MNYRIHFRGNNLGILSLDELRQRRLGGGMTGQEFVWAEGMSEWKKLDDTLFESASVPPWAQSIAGGLNRSRSIVVMENEIEQILICF